jgi:CHAD domain-containing protein
MASAVATFDVRDDFALPDVAAGGTGSVIPVLSMSGVALDERRQRVLTTYWDTPGLRLARGGVVLHWSSDRWEIAGPGDEGSSEVGGRFQPPDELVRPLSGYVGGAPLMAVLTVDTDRRTLSWSDVTQRVALEVDDDRVVAERLRDGTVITWREVRVVGDEGSGEGDAAACIVRAIRHAGAEASPRRGGHALEVLEAAAAMPDPADLLATRLGGLSIALGAGTVALHRGDTEAIHDLRVAIRRSASCLRTFGPLLDPAGVDPLPDELAWFGALLGEARDAEVLARRFDRRLNELEVTERLGPVREDLVGTRRALADAHADAALATTSTDRFRSMVDALHRLWADPPYRPGQSGGDVGALERCAHREVRRTRRRARLAMATPPGDARDHAFHQVRKAAKRVRYAAETLTPARPKAGTRLARRYEAVQEVLGEHHDAAVARRILTVEGARTGVRPGRNGFTYGVLAERERQAAADAEARWDAVWHKATCRSMRRLLRH